MQLHMRYRYCVRMVCIVYAVAGREDRAGRRCESAAEGEDCAWQEDVVHGRDLHGLAGAARPS